MQSNKVEHSLLDQVIRYLLIRKRECVSACKCEMVYLFWLSLCMCVCMYVDPVCPLEWQHWWSCWEQWNIEICINVATLTHRHTCTVVSLYCIVDNNEANSSNQEGELAENISMYITFQKMLVPFFVQIICVCWFSCLVLFQVIFNMVEQQPNTR